MYIKEVNTTRKTLKKDMYPRLRDIKGHPKSMENIYIYMRKDKEVNIYRIHKEKRRNDRPALT